jgi:hypothetical protein
LYTKCLIKCLNVGVFDFVYLDSASLLSSLGDDAFSVILLLSVLYLHDLCLLSNFASFFFFH